MKIDSGSHPNLYKLGMKIAKVSPGLFETGVSALNAPSKLKSDLEFQMSDKRIAKKINSVNLELTVLCNLRCSFCWWWGEKGIAPALIRDRDPIVSKELSLQEIYNVVDQLAADHMPSFYLSGGEPFIRKDTVDIIEYITKKGMSVITNNNGTLLNDEKMERLAKIKNLTINFSIDGPREVHDGIRGKGMYDKTTSTIKRLLELRGNSMFPAIKTNTTFSPWIQGRLDELIRDLQDNVGVDATRMQHLWFTDKEHAESHKKELNRIFGTNEVGVDAHVISTPDKAYVEALAKEILTVEKTKYKKPVFIHPRMNAEQIGKYYSDLSFTKQDRCRIAWGAILVKAGGDLMFCPDEWMSDFKIGNVRDQPIKEIWNNEKAQKFREELYKHKLFPACARCCVING